MILTSPLSNTQNNHLSEHVASASVSIVGVKRQCDAACRCVLLHMNPRLSSSAVNEVAFLEEAPEVRDLPDTKRNQTKEGDPGKVLDSLVCGFCVRARRVGRKRSGRAMEEKEIRVDPPLVPRIFSSRFLR